jgi:Sec-independent protein translocase protein TatA
MIEVSWSEIFVVSALGLAMIGRKDLPQAARTAGQSIGRIVGLLQGARARADKFTSHNELTQLQNELRSGLRELDAVKSELAVSMSGRGMMGRNLGSMTPSANRNPNAATTGVGIPKSTPRLLGATASEVSTRSSTSSTTGGIDSNSNSAAALQTAMSANNYGSTMNSTTPVSDGVVTNENERHLPPEKQTIAAVAEEEWATQGISFRSRAEQGSGLRDGAVQQSTSGSAILANLLQKTLIFDQYDRVVQEQDNILQSKIDSIQEKVQAKNKKNNKSSVSDADKRKE